MQNIAKITLLCIALLLSSKEVKSQSVSSIASADFRRASSIITHKTNNTYRLVRLGANHSPAIIAANKTARKLSEGEKNDLIAVQNFVRNESDYISANVLLLPDNAILKEAGTQRTGNLWLSSFIVSYNGIPLRERFLRINIGAISGEVMLVRNSIPAKKPNASSAKIAPVEVILTAGTLLHGNSEIQPPKLIYIDERENSSLRLCYEVIASEPDMYEMWRLTFDAMSGELIEQKSLVEHDCFVGATGRSPSSDLLPTPGRSAARPYDQKPIGFENPQSGASGMVLAKVHLHDPYDTLTTVGLPYAMLNVNGVNIVTDSTGVWSLPSAEYPVTVQTSFNSPFFSVLRQDNIPNSKLTKIFLSGETTVLWANENSDDAERDAYYSASLAHLADKRVDEKLTGIDFHMKVNVNFNASCNAFYIPKDTSINFFSAGSECSNTAEISDVVFHEYGHRVTNARYTLAAGYNNNIVDGSLSEGFADLNSAFIRDDPRIGIGFFGDPKKTLRVIRSCDNTKKWPRDISPDIHISGEIISGAFWDLRKIIGHDISEHLFHFMEYQLPDGTGMTDSASLEDAFTSTLAAVILTDDDDNNLANGTPHVKEILAAFELHNISLARFLDAEVAEIKDQDTSVNEYPIRVNISYNGIIGGIDSSSLKLFYSLDKGKTFESVPYAKDGTDGFVAKIPKAPAGTVIKYYASCATTEGDIVTSPPGSAYTFFIGFKRVLFDDCEQDRGWSLSDASDKATTGFWVRDKPRGTYADINLPMQYIQQDTDHTPYLGTMCYVTGNRIDPLGDKDPNFAGYDDVDSGATTLTTPPYDLTKFQSPYIRYWYYFSNDKGTNPRITIWETDISDDNGSSWKIVQRTSESTNARSGFPEWKDFTFRVRDYVQPSAFVKIRFIASCYTGTGALINALVEAGVDDFEILDSGIPESGIPKTEIRSALPYPNPIRRGEKLHVTGTGTMSLIDMLGRTVITVDGDEVLIPNFIPPGIYFIGQAGQKFKVVVF